MKVTLDRITDAAYIYMAEEDSRAVVTHACDPGVTPHTINLDFGASGVLNGIEVISASPALPSAVLDGAEIIDSLGPSSRHRRPLPIKVRWWRERDVAYIDMLAEYPFASVVKTIALDTSIDGLGDYDVNLHFDASDILLSVEIRAASARLPKILTDGAELVEERHWLPDGQGREVIREDWDGVTDEEDWKTPEEDDDWPD